MLKKIELVIILLAIAGFAWMNSHIVELVTAENVEKKEYVVVLDAGHGGKDPGKVGVNNILEKDVNLQIAIKIKELLEKEGIKVVMTREKDEMLCEESTDNQKLQDMKNRVEIIDEAGPDLVVSIHQNSFSDSSVYGAQVFYYSGSEEGKIIAASIQNSLWEIDENQKRQVKENDSYYLLKHTDVPTVIVECGFLSNQNEAEKLATEEYQNVISNAIVRGIEACFVN